MNTQRNNELENLRKIEILGKELVDTNIMIEMQKAKFIKGLIVDIMKTNEDSDKSFCLVNHIHRQMEFSKKTFGEEPRINGVINHIREEIDEIEEKPDDLEEWVDLFLLSLDGMWRMGFSPSDIVNMINYKQDKNEKRKWEDFRTADPDKPIKHIE